MNIESLRDYCLSKPQATESFPFDVATLVFKVGGKMFALTSMEKVPPSVNLKCDPEKSLDLQACYKYVKPGFHMNKKHWITVSYLSMSDNLICELVDQSYDLVVDNLSKSTRSELNL
jgi:predicted DNA-binding protein (MmcQ/YjbR family)